MKEMKQQNTVGLFMEQKYKKTTNNNVQRHSFSLTYTHTHSQYFEYCDEWCIADLIILNASQQFQMTIENLARLWKWFYYFSSACMKKNEKKLWNSIHFRRRFLIYLMQCCWLVYKISAVTKHYRDRNF